MESRNDCYELVTGDGLVMEIFNEIENQKKSKVNIKTVLVAYLRINDNHSRMINLMSQRRPN